jgi:hypothetical protein
MQRWLQAKQGRVQGPGTPPQAGAAVLPPAAPPPTATKRRRKRAIFPHLSAAELLIHPVFGALAHIGKPEQLPTQVFMESEPHPSYTPAHQAFPASAHGSSAPTPLRLLRSNAAGFPHSNTVKHGQVGAACSLDLLPAKKRAAFSPSDAGGSPAMAARARARELSATRAASVKVRAYFVCSTSADRPIFSFVTTDRCLVTYFASFSCCHSASIACTQESNSCMMQANIW